MAKTTGAKNKIKDFYKKIDKAEYLKNGEEIFNKELRKKKLAFDDILKQENIDKILTVLKYKQLDEVYINIGNGKLSPSTILNIITDENDSKEEIILKKVQNKEITAPIVKKDILVEGIDDIKINIASCCKPIPGDHIIGYITKGNGITIHRAFCPNVKELEERIIMVNWNEEISKKYPTSLLIKALKVDNLLLEIMKKTSNNNISLQSINTYTGKDDVNYEIVVLVENKETLSKFMNEVRGLKNIIECERLIK